VSLKNESDKVIVYERAGLLFIFNFHPTKSFTDYRVGVEEAGEYRIVLSSDEGRFGGFDNIMLDSKFFHEPDGMEWQEILFTGLYSEQNVHFACKVISDLCSHFRRVMDPKIAENDRHIDNNGL